MKRLTISVMAATCAALCQAAAVRAAADAKAMKYSPMIFGHFIEHFDNQIYGGVFEPGSPLSDEDGFRKDVIEALKEIKCPVVRWPGGCFVSSYHWKYGVGPHRTPVWDKAWQVEDPNTFGTDEYVKWCRKVGCEPYICTNAGTGSPEEMGDWVEYCNLTAGIWGRQRMVNGFPAPHNVKYWSVGNENWGKHEIGAKTVEEWGPFVRESAKMMRGVDRSVILFAAATPDEKWTLPLLKSAGYLLDFVSVHGYYDPIWRTDKPSSYLQCMLRTEKPEEEISGTIKVLEKAGFGGGKIAIAFDEWNLRAWHHPGMGRFGHGDTMDIPARRRNDRASVYTMADALFSACFLNTCLRHCDVVKMANFSPVVNTRGTIFVHPKGIVKRTTWHVFWMYTHLLEANVMPLEVECAELSDGKKSVPVLDAVLSVSDDGLRRVLAVVNKSPADAQELDVSALVADRASALAATILDGDLPDAYNDIGAEERVVPRKVSLAVRGGKVTIPPHSLAMIEFDAPSPANAYDIAAYVWPAYQPEPRWRELGIFADGDGEWQNVREAVPKWEGHRQPVVPLWGYENEADPKVVEKKIDAAISHGVNVFIYDWYWYGGRPFLEDALDKGFLGAANSGKMKFFVMWANHDVTHLWNNKIGGGAKNEVVWPGTADGDEFRKIGRRWLEMYFWRQNYYRIGGRPVLMIYDVPNFVKGMGGLDNAASAIAWLRGECEKTGLGGLHLMACDWHLSRDMVERLSIDSATIYSFIHWSGARDNPDYADWAAKGAERFNAARESLGLGMYFPHASAGWDQNPRWPAGHVRGTALDATPEKFEAVLRRAKDWCDVNTPPSAPKLISINAWNEWTEGAYLEPDTRFGYSNLEAIRKVFAPEKRHE